MNPWVKRTLPYAAVVLATATATSFVVRARAAGIPEADVLTYTGYLEDADGNALTDAHAIDVTFWGSADGNDDLCTGGSDEVALLSGRFQVPLPDCTDAVKGNRDIWVDVQVDAVSLGRTKLGAVPFALEAGHATSADQLARQQSAFRAGLSANQSVAPHTYTDLAFDIEEFDLGDELDEATGEFAPRVAGFYQLQCAVNFEQTVFNTVAYWRAGIAVNDVAIASIGGKTDGQTVGRTVSTLAKLEVGDVVTCQASHEGDVNQAVRKDTGTRFEGARQAVWE